MARRGSVYCMANDEMPRVVKIGATLRCPEDRLNDARSTTWAPTCFRIIAQALVEDAFAAEQAIHALLAHRRLEARREFFRVTHAEARALFAAVQLTACPEAAEAGETDDQVSEGDFASGEHGEADEAGGPYDLLGETDTPSRVQSGRSQRLAPTGESAQAAASRLRSWVESKYTHITHREKDTGTKLEALFSAYAAARPPVHQKPLGRNKFAQMLSAVYPGIGPHKNTTSTVNGLYLLR